MIKKALITGASDGIGRETAIELAKIGYSIHVLGINKERGIELLKILNRQLSDGEHELFIVDLSEMKQVNKFLNYYTNRYKSLDILVLNAGIFPKKKTLSKDGIDLSFSVGYVSRYLFSIKLNTLLEKSNIGKVIHISGSVVGKIHYSKLNKPTYNKMTSVWQNSVGSALIVNNWKKITQSSVAHMHWNPGIVNTQTVKSQSKTVQILSKLMGMIEPNKAGKMLAQNIEQYKANEVNGKFFLKGTMKTKNIKHNSQKLKDLLKFSISFTSQQYKN